MFCCFFEQQVIVTEQSIYKRFQFTGLVVISKNKIFPLVNTTLNIFQYVESPCESLYLQGTLVTFP